MAGQFSWGWTLEEVLVPRAIDTNKLEKLRGGALAQAVEVYAGAWTPLVWPSRTYGLGSQQIMIQFPGLSEADQAKAKKLVTEAAFLEFALFTRIPMG
ncbi:MAG: hypothetical protein Ct9H300mP32_3240 [Verrucomicrobiota bacterium]|nr:MAG: hypothetical protein Ct9H300mP32_3240 [Verrucomicrobiota bacterium]